MEQPHLQNEPFVVTGQWEFKISTCGLYSTYNLLPQGRGVLALKCHNSICLSAKCCLHESGQTKHKGWYRADANMTITILHLKLHNWHRDNKKEEFRPKNDTWSKSKCHDSRHLYNPSAGSCLHKPGHTKDEGWNYRLTFPHLKLQMKLVDLLRCPLEDRALGKNTSD